MPIETPHEGDDLDAALEAARRLAALSSQTEDRLARFDARGLPLSLQVCAAFKEIGRAMASKKEPVSDKDLKRLLAEAEKLIHSENHEIANAVATDLLEAIWDATHGSGFDFTRINPHLGPESRRYLIAWDDFHRVKTNGLTR
jgi:hypothetical protein